MGLFLCFFVLIMPIKKALLLAGLFILILAINLAGNYVGCTWAFLALADFELNGLTFVE